MRTWTYTKYLAFTVLLTASHTALQAQMTADDIEREKMLIDANREKLLGNYDEAIDILRDLHRQELSNAAVAYELGRLYLSKDDKEEAVRFLKIALEKDAENEWYVKYLADIYQMEGRNEEGAQLYDELITRSPGEQYLYFKKAFFLVRAQQLTQALEVYQQAEKIVGYNEEIGRRRHSLYMGMGDFAKAEKELIRLTESYPASLEFLHILAAFYEKQENADAANRVYQKIVALAPNDPKATMALSGGSTKNSDELAYLESLEAAFKRADVGVDLKMSKLFPFITNVAETGSVPIADGAIHLTDIMEEVHPSNAKVYAAAGDLYFNSGRLKEAAQKYLLTIERDKSVFPVWMQLLQAYYYMGDFEALAEHSNNALDVYPNRAILQYYLAIAKDELGDYNEALDALSLATLMAGRDANLQAEAKALEAQVFQHQDKLDKANTAFNAAQKLNADNPDLNYRYAQFLLAKNDLKAAVQANEKAVKAIPFNPYYSVGLSKIQYAQKDYEAAAVTMAVALKNGAQYWSHALELAGDTAFQLGKVDEALQYWGQAKEAGENSERLNNKIANKSL